jgi:serpin B
MKFRLRVKSAFAIFTGTAVALSAIVAVRGNAMNVTSATDPDTLSPTDRRAQAVAASGVDFGFRLLHEVDRGADGRNVFVSPFSISQALAMTMDGAGGETRSGMARTLGMADLSPDDIDAGSAQLLTTMQHPEPDVELSIANALWIRQNLSFDPAYQQRVKTTFDADTTTLNMSNSSAAAATINEWVDRYTHGKIRELVTPGLVAISPAILTNAIYFHGGWQTPFLPEATSDAAFTLESGATKRVRMMERAGRLAYAETDRFQAVRLPYGSGRVSMIVLLPKPGTSVDALLGDLDSRSWESTTAAMKPATVHLFLPRFEASYVTSLKEPLIALGMGNAFEGQADFRPMGLEGRGYIGDVIHKAVLQVDEKGTVAAAATAVVMTRAAVFATRPPVMVRVDHPFLCVIYDDPTGALLFAGAIRNPEPLTGAGA